MRVRASCVYGIATIVTLLAAPRAASAQAIDQWQAHLANGRYMYELQFKALRGNEAVFEHAGKIVQLRLGEIDELRRIHKSFKHGTGGARATFGGLAGADDDVFQISQYSVSEKRDILTKVLAVVTESSTSVSQGNPRH